MDFLALGVITVVVLLVFFLIDFFTKKPTSKTTKITETLDLPKTTKDLSKPVNIKDLEFPKNIEKMNINALAQASRVIFDSYKALDYVNKLPSAMDKIEWHTWQVSILLYFYKMEGQLAFFNKDKYFHSTILELTYEQRKQEMQRILKKYLNSANIQKDRDTLSKDVIWTARDVTILFFEIIKDK